MLITTGRYEVGTRLGITGKRLHSSDLLGSGPVQLGYTTSIGYMVVTPGTYNLLMHDIY